MKMDDVSTAVWREIFSLHLKWDNEYRHADDFKSVFNRLEEDGYAIIVITKDENIFFSESVPETGFATVLEFRKTENNEVEFKKFSHT